MSKALPPKPRSLQQKNKILIVASTYNEQFTTALVENTQQELEELMPNSQVELIRVPGAFEIPATTEAILRAQNPDCIICLGLIIRGQTAHGDMVAQSVTHALQGIAVNHAKPIVHEVILVDDEPQAYARCIGAKINRGHEAARAAVSILNTFSQINRSNKRPNTRSFPNHG